MKPEIRLYQKHNGEYELHADVCEHNTVRLDFVGEYNTYREAEAVWENNNEMGTTLKSCLAKEGVL